MRVRASAVVALIAAWVALASPSAAGMPRLYSLTGDARVGNGRPAGLSRVEAECVGALADGSVLATGGARVWRIRRDGRVVAVAGTGRSGFSGDGGPATRARISGCGVAGLPDGGFLLADGANGRLRRVDAHGVITTIAGTGGTGLAGFDGPARRAWIGEPSRVAVRGDGTVFVLSDEGSLLERIGRDGRLHDVAGIVGACASSPGVTTTGSLLRPGPLAASGNGKLLFSDEECVLRASGRGRVAVVVPDVYARALAPTPGGVSLSRAPNASRVSTATGRRRSLPGACASRAGAATGRRDRRPWRTSKRLPPSPAAYSCWQSRSGSQRSTVRAH